ncbi:MAG: hypothetical protein C0613_11445 [Desulfobulbaceae bacterium]|nr:MAG: hypothetical protein C0613_11445 [Desulfobulbaceae bacterium]
MNRKMDANKEADPPLCRLCGQALPGPEQGVDQAADGLCPFCRLEEESCGCSDEEQEAPCGSANIEEN